MGKAPKIPQEQRGLGSPKIPSRAGLIFPHPHWTPTGRISPHYPTVTPKIWGTVIPTLSRLSYPARSLLRGLSGLTGHGTGDSSSFIVSPRAVAPPGRWSSLAPSGSILPMAAPAGDAGSIQDLLPTASIPGRGETPNHPKIIGKGVTPAWMGVSKLG